MVKTTYMWTASDPAYAAVNGEDILPDLAIGRLPAANVEEVERLVAKILAYETGEVTLAGTAVLVADNPTSRETSRPTRRRLPRASSPLVR